ncbi:MAG: T9SS type A sorting domain-containing protein [Aureispira sp.]|nr:T9SS type A sorting domain-containing protein [Aureispira sp.]
MNIALKTAVLFLLIFYSQNLFGQNPSTYNVVSLCNLNLNRTATKLSPTQLSTVSPAYTGFIWNSGDNATLSWRPQGITTVPTPCKKFVAVSWYGRSSQGYANRGVRISFADISDINNINYRHVLLVDESWNTFHDMHGGGIFYKNDTLYVPDSRSGGKYVYAFDLTDIREVPSADLSTFYNYGFIVKRVRTDTIPIVPSFISYDWDDQQMLAGKFNNCGSPYCSPNSVNTLAWYQIGNVDGTAPYHNGFFGKMQGATSLNHSNDPTKKMIWVSTSYGSGNASYLYATTYDRTQGQTANLGNNYHRYQFPSGLEDLHFEEDKDTLWTLTEFGTNDGSGYDRLVFAMTKDNILPPGVCLGNNNITQNYIRDTLVCPMGPLSYTAYTDYVAYADFNKSDDDWVEINATTSSLVGTDRSAFMWIKHPISVSSESQMLFAINTSSGGNICNLQIGTNENVGIYDGANSHYGTTATTVTDGQWHYVGYTYQEATGETKIYVDGTLETTFIDAQTVVGTAQISLGQEFDSGNAKSNFLEGQMTEVSIWNKVLTPSDITLLMQTTIDNTHPSYSNLVAYYPMNIVCAGDVAILEDISGNNLHGIASAPIQTVNDLDQIPNFNSAAHYNKNWLEGGVSISTNNNLQLSSYTSNNYSLELTRNNHTITDNWNIQTIDTSVQLAGLTITANQVGATYQWLDCNNGNAVIGGETNSSYTASSNGNYAVEISQNGCTDTSACTAITVVGLAPKTWETTNLKVFPNPTTGILNILLDEPVEELSLNVRTLTGQLVLEKNYKNRKEIELGIEDPAGVYIVELSSDRGVARFKIIKE